jgi:hypothetical protein
MFWNGTLCRHRRVRWAKLTWVMAAGGASLVLCCSSSFCRAQQDEVPLRLDGGLALPRSWTGPQTSQPMKRRPSPGVVPYRVAGDGAIPEFTPATTGCTLSYFGGPVISNVQVVPVFWGPDVNAAVTATGPTGIAQFYADAAQSNWFGAMSEYNTNISGGTGQPIGYGTSLAGITITPSICPGSATCTVTDAQVQTELNNQIGAGGLPPILHDTLGYPTTLYIVHFPPKVTIDARAIGAGYSCTGGGFCAYHYTGTTSSGEALAYAVLPDQFATGCNSGCGLNATTMNNVTYTVSHELAESVTDTDAGLCPGASYAYPCAWASNQTPNNGQFYCGEIADICDTGTGGTITVSGRTWTVAGLWSNKNNTCEVGDAFTASAMGTGIWIGNGNSSLSVLEEDNGIFKAKSAYTGGGLSTVAGPQGVAIDSVGDVWVASAAGVSEFNLDGSPVAAIAYTAGVSNPGGLAIDGNSNVWVANGDGTVAQLSNYGILQTTVTDSSFRGPGGIAIDASGSVWVTNATTNTLSEIVGAAAPSAALAQALANNKVGSKP